MPDAKKQGRSNKAMTFFVCFLAALAGLLFGLDIGVIAGALPFIADEFQITSHTQEWVVSSMMFGAAVGAVGSGWLSFKLGRKKSLMIGAILFVAGSLFSAAAPNVEVLILSRVLLGLAVGVASYTAPLYLSEIAPEKIRGSMISMYQLMITIGILGAYLSDTAFSYTGAWRWMLGVIIIPAILLLIGVFFLPDSPRWFAAKRRFVDAERVLLRLRDTSAEAKRELDEIREGFSEEESEAYLDSEKENTFDKKAITAGAKAKKDVVEAETKEKLKKIVKLWEEQKNKNKQIKEAKQTLIDKTVKAIENLSDEDISLFLHKKWIDPIVKGIDETLAEVLSTFKDKVCALGKKYAVSYKHLNEDLEKSQKELSGLINELTGDEFAILGLNELINN